MFKAKKAFRKFFKIGKIWLIKLTNVAFDVWLLVVKSKLQSALKADFLSSQKPLAAS